MNNYVRSLVAASLLAGTAAVHAAAPDTEAVEFYNALTGHYFITASASDVLTIDKGGAGPGWMRTGRSFQAWTTASGATPDAQPVCRFYSSDANSHFYTASAGECAQLRTIESQQRAANGGSTGGWAFEGVAFFVQTPQDGQCPAGTTPITRMYNHGFENGQGANHRFVDAADLQALMAARGWSAEGTAFCVAPKSRTGTNANLAQTTSSFDNLAGTWSGPAHWETEASGTESEATHDLSLTFAADGTLTGSGDGCTFTGAASLGDGFRSFFEGTASATGCSDAAFNGDYPRLRLERFGTDTLMVHLQRGDGSTEASIEARLVNGSPAQPAPAPLGGVAGDWSGTVAWLATQLMSSGNVVSRVAANQPLALSIAADLTVTGTGGGCTISGTLSASSKRGAEAADGTSGSGDDGHDGSGNGADDSGGTGGGSAQGGPDDGQGDTHAPQGTPASTGSLTFAGCDQAVFNGTFTDARVVRTGPARIAVALERDMRDAQGATHVEIEGELQAGS